MKSPRSLLPSNVKSSLTVIWENGDWYSSDKNIHLEIIGRIFSGDEKREDNERHTNSNERPRKEKNHPTIGVLFQRIKKKVGGK